MHYTIKSGDTLGRIAARHGISLDDLLRANPQYASNPNLIRVGDRVEIPGPSGPAGPQAGSADDPFVVPRGQLTFDAEGSETRGRYFSRVPHVPGPWSGVTIGRGYDMKSKSKTKIKRDLAAAGVDSNIAEKFAPASGLMGDQAKDFIRVNNLKKIEISPQQQKKLFISTYDDLEKDVIRICNKPDVVKRYGVYNWKNLNPVIRDVVVDLRYRGDYTGKTRRKIQKPVADNDLAAFTTAMLERKYWLEDIGVPKNRFKRRCDYLRNA